MTTLKGEVLGFRSWKIGRGEGGLELHSSGLGKYRWRPDHNEAVCQLDLFGGWFETTPWWERIHDAPAHDCTCGLYAYHEPPMLSNWELCGAVLGWGRMEVHHRGWRAQYAKPVLFGVPPAIRDYPEAYELLRELAFRFDAKLLPEDSIECAAKAFGDTIPEDMRPPKPPKPEGKQAVYWTPGNVTVPDPATFRTGSAIRQLWGTLGGGQ